MGSIQILSDLPRSREAKTPGLDLELRSTCVVWIFEILPVAWFINVNVSSFKLGYHIDYRLLFVLTRGWLAAVCSHDIASYKVTHVMITLQLAVTSLYFRFSLGDFYATFWHMTQLWKHFHARSCTTGLMHVFWTVWNPWEMFIVWFTMGLFGKVPTNSWTLGWSDLMAFFDIKYPTCFLCMSNTDNICKHGHAKFYTCLFFVAWANSTRRGFNGFFPSPNGKWRWPIWCPPTWWSTFSVFGPGNREEVKYT